MTQLAMSAISLAANQKADQFNRYLSLYGTIVSYAKYLKYIQDISFFSTCIIVTYGKRNLNEIKLLIASKFYYYKGNDEFCVLGALESGSSARPIARQAYGGPDQPNTFQTAGS